MALTLQVPQEYGYVLLSATASTIVGVWHNTFVGRYRRASKVPLPNAYASHAEAKEDRAKLAFNCAQRSHANFLEHQPQFLTALLIAGLRYPVVSAGMGFAWCIARVMYAFGYVSGVPGQGMGRQIGGWFYFPEFGLIGMAAWTGWKMAMP